MRKSMRTFGAVLTTAALSLTMLAGCGSSSKAPGDFKFDTSTGSFSFKTVEGGDTYIVGVSKVLNDTTGEALQSINGSATVEIDGTTKYLWSEQTGSASGLSDTDGDGTVDGSVVFREYSSSASTVGDVISIADIPLGHYVVQAIPGSTDELTDPEAATFEFVQSGTLAEPDGFTAAVNDSGVIEITAPSDYYLTCMTETGLPNQMKFEVKDGDTVVETITMDDFSYTNTVNGPNKMFTFNNQTVTGTEKLDSSKDYTVTVTAVGDGDTILDASADAYMASKSDEAKFATTYDTAASGTAGVFSIKLTLGTDASGANLYELTASANDVVIEREVGTYTASAEATTVDEKNTFADGTTLTFTSTESDFETPVMDGKTYTVVKSEQQGFMPGAAATVNYSIEGSATADGETFEFSASSGMMGFGPM